MIFRLSQKVNTKVKAGALKALALHENPLLDWSAHSFLLNRRQFILISNTKSMLSVVLPGKGITNQTLFTERAFDGFRSVWNPTVTNPSSGESSLPAMNRFDLRRRSTAPFRVR